MKLNCYDITAETAIDYMHCTLLGVMKQLLSLWKSTLPLWYITNLVQYQCISSFKASELWFFCYIHYSLPVLFNIFPPAVKRVFFLKLVVLIFWALQFWVLLNFFLPLWDQLWIVYLFCKQALKILSLLRLNCFCCVVAWVFISLTIF